jgi:MscS family membrane protein
LLASAGIFGLAVAMASKSIIENFLSGLILFADKTINVGDTIVLSDGTTAVVEEINIRTTRLRTFDGNVVIIPNSELLNEKIINKSLSEVSPQKRVEVTV